ncbi:hypothetical protein G6L37_06595 [Agrobacterium rubi]|nr:hypothetical protein [Agrobacterium rubi]NTF25032.1 hypothetical protein [Agrobacterium rubi]
MPATAIFVLATMLSPTLSAAYLHTPEPRARFILASGVVIALACAVYKFLSDPRLFKLVILTASGLTTVSFMLIAVAAASFPSRVCEGRP